MSAIMNTVAGTWRAASPSSTPSTSRADIDLEAQVVVGQREPVSYALTLASPMPLRTSTPRAQAPGTNPIDDFFGVPFSAQGTQDSRHDERRSSLYLDAPPPYVSEDTTGLPSYASIAEPPTLAMYLFKFGFLFPLFWLAGVFVLLFPLQAPEGWEPTKTDTEREELLVCLRRTEIKWAKRCLVAFSALTVVVIIVTLLALFARRA